MLRAHILTRQEARPMAKDSLSVTDNRTGKSYDIPIIDGTVRAMDFRQIKTSDDDFGLMTYDPAFTNTASCASAITFIDGDQGSAGVSRLSDRATRRAQHVPRDGVSHRLRAPADEGGARRVDAPHHVPHAAARKRQEVRRRVPLRRAPDGHADQHDRARCRRSTRTRRTSTTRSRASCRRGG